MAVCGLFAPRSFFNTLIILIILFPAASLASTVAITFQPQFLGYESEVLSEKNTHVPSFYGHLKLDAKDRTTADLSF